MSSVPSSTPANNNGFWNGFGGLLDSAIGGWARIEEIKAAKASTGQSRVEQALTPEYDNAAVVIDTPKTATTAQPQEPMVFGFPQKQVILGFTGLLVLGLVLRGRK
jgi:phospholipase C